MLSKIIKCFIRGIILLLSFILYAAEVPSTQVKVVFEGEEVISGRSPVLTIDTSKFPFFAGHARVSKGKIFKTHEFSYSAINIANALHDIMKKNYNTIQSSFRHGTYIIPKDFNEVMSQYELSFTDILNLMEQIDAINRPDLLPLVEYEYARKLTQGPMMPEDIDIKQGESPENAAKRYITFEPTVEAQAQIAKIIIDHALIKKARYNCSDIKVWFDVQEDTIPAKPHTFRLNIEKKYLKKQIDVGIDASYYFCPTNFADNLIFIKTKKMEYNSRILKVFSGKKKDKSTYEPGVFDQKYKMPACDYSYDNERKVAVIISPNAISKLEISYLSERSHMHGLIQDEGKPKKENTTNQKKINLGTEGEASESKLIFEPNKDKDGHIFYLKFNNNIYKGNADEHTINLQEPIDITNITDAWVKKYLTDDDAMVDSCPAVAYAEDQTEPFFNTRCLHALCFEGEGKAQIMKALSDAYGSTLIPIVQCTCDPNNDSHYYLLIKKYGNYLDYRDYKVASIRFKPDERMQESLDLMNTLKKGKDEDTYLIPNALYIYWLYTEDFRLKEEEIGQKMGILYQFVSHELKRLFIPAPRYVPERKRVYDIRTEILPQQPTADTSFIKRGVKHIIESWIKPNISYIQRGWIKSNIGYIKTLGTLSAGAIGYTLINRLPNEQKNMVLSGMLLLGLAHLGMLRYFHNK
ncbi:MAG TPA: hypothetical protein VGW78_05150 [Candidatus Babeliales bacterium]|nr:hypothetical protein [Candidatus Babeliales bacterium]